MGILKTTLCAVLIAVCAAAVQAQKPGPGTAPGAAAGGGEGKQGAQKAHKAYLLGDELLLQMPEPLAKAMRAEEGGPRVVAEFNGVGVGRVRNQIKTIEGVITVASAAEGAGEAMAGEAIKKFLKAQMADKAEGSGLRRFLLLKKEGIWKEGQALKVQVLYPEKQEFLFKVGAAKKTLTKDLGKTAGGQPTPGKSGGEKDRPE
ncbi:MAG: hypothetical protein A2X36_10485 [Elusimicrobia bacterium GWA2_69_24]|nr:MAG: hypothetical protein A2X36_10485 [Elusimicrobia bacterium GWA2_69_24]HBL15724.1 hypothetical protein [Elusimicrobiota bacterium]